MNLKKSDKYKLLLSLKKELSAQQIEDKINYHNSQQLISKIKKENLLHLQKSLSSVSYKISETKKQIISRTKVLYIIELLMKKVRINSDFKNLNEMTDFKYEEEINYLVSLLNKVKE